MIRVHPEFLECYNIELGALEVPRNGVNAFRPMLGNILEAPESL